MSQIYEIRLKPIGSFYFGGEESFSSSILESVINKNDESVKKYYKKRQGYFAKSEMFPQQTQLLGMIRKEILRLNNKLLYYKRYTSVPKDWKDKATKIVGSKWYSNKEEKMGTIALLSPLYLHHATYGLCVPAPMDYELMLETTGVAYINGIPKKAVAFKKCNGKYFDAKDYLYSKYHSLTGEYVDMNDIFKPQIRTHTQKLHYKEGNEEQLFKVQRYTLDEDYHFVFYLTLNNDSYLLDDTKTAVTLGGEESHFIMSVNKTDAIPDIDAYYHKLRSKETRVVLLSDAYISSCDAKNTVFNDCKVVLSQKRVLRTLQSMRKDKQFHFKKSTKTILLAKGTVFYPKNEDALGSICAVLNKSNYQAIGYNQYITLQGETNAN